MKKKYWKGHTLIGVDGSTLNLPPSKDIENKFGFYAATDKGTKRYLARICFFYDVLNDYVLEWELSTMKEMEKDLMRKCLNNTDLPSNSILILDRGFGNITTVKELMHQNTEFCLRISNKLSHFGRNAMQNQEDDFITFWEPTRDERYYSKKLGLEKAPVKVRVTKVKLKTGETELLVSNLFDQEKYTIQDMAELYHLRWGVEEGFKNLKPKMKIEQFGCRKSEGVLQEFHAHVFMMNMVSLVGLAASERIAEKTANRNLKYKYNWKNAYRFLRERIIEFLSFVDIQNLLDLLITEVTSSLIAVKPNRSFTRDTRDLSRRSRLTQFNK